MALDSGGIDWDHFVEALNSIDLALGNSCLLMLIDSERILIFHTTLIGGSRVAGIYTDERIDGIL